MGLAVLQLALSAWLLPAVITAVWAAHSVVEQNVTRVEQRWTPAGGIAAAAARGSRLTSALSGEKAVWMLVLASFLTPVQASRSTRSDVSPQKKKGSGQRSGARTPIYQRWELILFLGGMACLFVFRGACLLCCRSWRWLCCERDNNAMSSPPPSPPPTPPGEEGVQCVAQRGSAHPIASV